MSMMLLHQICENSNMWVLKSKDGKYSRNSGQFGKKLIKESSRFPVTLILLKIFNQMVQAKIGYLFMPKVLQNLYQQPGQTQMFWDSKHNQE